jgi:hypothetical protein
MEAWHERPLKRVVVTGMAGITGLGDDWQAIEPIFAPAATPCAAFLNGQRSTG